MDTTLYSQSVLDSFVKDKLCQKDKTLYKYYQEGNVKKFRKRLCRFSGVDDNIKTVVQTLITNATRDLIYAMIRILTKHMKNCGDLIISGGEAVNAYLESENRIITTDIDTKFTPLIKINSKLLESHDPRMFGYLQIAKLKMWDKLGHIVMRFNKIIVQRVKRLIVNKPIGKFLGISFSPGVHSLNRRYTLIKKSKELGTLIDVELFAVDLQMKYWLPSENRAAPRNIGGLLDIAFMRPLEFGFDATYTKDAGVYITTPLTKSYVYDKRVYVASRKFLIHDIYSMQKYNLRPTKRDKDRKRMYIFAKYALKIKDVSSKDSIDKLFRKSIRHASGSESNLSARPSLTKKEVSKILSINPYSYEKVTTVPDKNKIYKQLFYGLKTPDEVKIPGYYPTFSNYRFDIKKGEWVKNVNPLYIHNEATHRPTNITKFPAVNLQDTLYGYNPSRDSWMPKRLVRKAAMIPMVGLKIKVLH